MLPTILALVLVLVALALAPLLAQTERAQTPGGLIGPVSAPFDVPVPPLAAPSYEQQVVVLVNQERLTNGGLPPLKHVDLLDNSSELHSANMGTRNFFAHCDLDTMTWHYNRMTAAGYISTTNGENIAAGYATPEAVMAGWMLSPGHRANILFIGYREIGVGYVLDGTDSANVRADGNGDCMADSFGNGPFYRYWTQNFGRRNSVYPVVINREAVETISRTVSLYVYGAGFATEMRFQNETGAFSAWEPYTANKSWVLTAGSGTKEVTAEIRNGVGTVLAASDTIDYIELPPTDFYTLDPCRLVDTRGPLGALGGPALVAKGKRKFTISGNCSVPVTAVAVSVNVAVTGASVGGNLRLYPGDAFPVPLVATINYNAGQTKSNNAVVPLNASGEVEVFVDQSSGFVHFILDVNGYFE